MDEENLTEISGQEGIELFIKGPTIVVANLFSSSRIVQVHHKAVLLLSGGMRLLSLILAVFHH